MKLNQAMKRISLCLSAAVVATLLGAGMGHAGSITYRVDQTIGAGSVIGTIETNGTTGVLGVGDITGWNLTLNGVGSVFTLTPSDSVVLLTNSDVTATTTDLYFNFSGADDGYLLFQDGLFSGSHYYCDSAGVTACFQGASVVPQSFLDPSAQFAALAGNQIIGVVPEPASIALLAAGLAALGLMRRGDTA